MKPWKEKQKYLNLQTNKFWKKNFLEISALIIIYYFVDFTQLKTLIEMTNSKKVFKSSYIGIGIPCFSCVFKRFKTFYQNIHIQCTLQLTINNKIDLVIHEKKSKFVIWYAYRIWPIVILYI